MSAEWLRGPAEDATVHELGRAVVSDEHVLAFPREHFDLIDPSRAGALFRDPAKLRALAGSLLAFAEWLERDAR